MKIQRISLTRIALVTAIALPVATIGASRLLADEIIIDDSGRWCQDNYGCEGGNTKCITVGNVTCYQK